MPRAPRKIDEGSNHWITVSNDRQRLNKSGKPRSLRDADRVVTTLDRILSELEPETP